MREMAIFASFPKLNCPKSRRKSVNLPYPLCCKTAIFPNVMIDTAKRSSDRSRGYAWNLSCREVGPQHYLPTRHSINSLRQPGRSVHLHRNTNTFWMIITSHRECTDRSDGSAVWSWNGLISSSTALHESLVTRLENTLGNTIQSDCIRCWKQNSGHCIYAPFSRSSINVIGLNSSHRSDDLLEAWTRRS